MLIALVAASVAPASSPSRAASRPAHHDSPPGAAAGKGHEASEGVRLIAERHESVRGGSSCPADVPVRRYDVVSIAADITLNRYLDHDPDGRMFVLAGRVAAVRDEERANALARAGKAEPAATIGLQGDAIQPLALRVHPGECLRVTLRNDIPGEPASFHVHGSSLRIAGTGRPAVATNPESIAPPGRTVTYEWMVQAAEPEGTHYVHSHGDTRAQTSHGLFGAVIVEPKGSRWLDPRTGSEEASGWDAAIVNPDGTAFREFVLVYHEIGNENEQIRDRGGAFVPQVDPLLPDYRPGTRALNYRSEPFMNRLKLQKSRLGFFDESVSYSSYTFGDPATPLMRTYLADRVKERVLHGGSEVFHVHHVHGGSIRWRRQPGAENVGPAGLNKHPPLLPTASERIDSQTIGPSETYDAENECGAGGCQQSPGDYLYHCHVAQHYFAGMWGLWRVYNTTQDGRASTDALPPLAELPGREGRMRPAVRSHALIGSVVGSSSTRLTTSSLGAWVERQLPPAGVPADYDASVMDWSRRGPLYLNEPETTQTWPGHRPREPDTRPPILFDPESGKLAYPFLRPHLGKRPPFAPGHGPSPYLDPVQAPGTVPAPGENGPESVCPKGTRLKTYRMHAIEVPITYNRRERLVDPAGEIYVLKSDEARARSDNAFRRPLALRANAGEDCVDILLANELSDGGENHGFAKVNAHIHFMQFDVQASDGVIAGFNYEQSVRPFRSEGEAIARASPAGSRTLRLVRTQRFRPGAEVGVGMDSDRTFEVARIAAVRGNELLFASPLRFAHSPREIVSAEFVRYRWYPDVQFGTAYFHDHVNAISSWKRGLFGAVISEPPGSTYTDPYTGAPVESGPIADINTDRVVSADVKGSFRELVMFIQDENAVTQIGRSTGSSFNLRAEPLADAAADPSRIFARAPPETPLLDAYVGDPIAVRTLVAGTNDIHTWHLDGHWFRTEPFSATSPPTNTVQLGISERFDLFVPAAGGPQRRAGNYLYYSGRTSKLREGSWGTLRVLDPNARSLLRPLPGRTAPSLGTAAPSTSGTVCPPDSRARTFAISAIEVPLPMLGGKPGRIFVASSRAADVLARPGLAQPLVLHAGVGDCIRIDLQNRTSDPISLHADLLAYQPGTSGPSTAGQPVEPAARNATRSYTFYASPEIGETVSLLRDWGNVLSSPGRGLYGAIVVGPRGARFLDPVTGRDSPAGSTQTVVVPPLGSAYRDFTLFMQDDDVTIGTHRMPYSERVHGIVGLNYRSAPLADRLALEPDPSRVFMTDARHGDPPTPLLQAYAGDPVSVRVVVPWSEQSQVFSVENHRWPLEPGRAGTTLLGSVRVGGLEALTLRLDGGAGGPEHLPGDYVYGNHREPYREAGLWGIFRVHPSCGSARGLARIGEITGRPVAGVQCGGRGPLWLGAAAALILLVLLGGRRLTRRRTSLRSSVG